MSDKQADVKATTAATAGIAPHTVTLQSPIKRGDQAITAVTVRKPQSGELRGTSLSDLLQLDVSALITVLPRITLPTLLTHELQQMDPADLVQLGTEVVGFLLTRAKLEEASLAL